MTNLSKIKRDKMIAFLEHLKEHHKDDESIKAFSEIENHLRNKKYGLVWEEHEEDVDEKLKNEIPIFLTEEDKTITKDKNLPYNFILEGDNLQALYLLEKTHRGKIDCIYIDPPYNTGAKDWKYNNNYVDSNDAYRHSKWLSMMKNRLYIAKRLLNPEDSTLIVTIDEKEYIRLGALLEELFPEARIQMVSTVINPHGANRKNMFARVEEYIYFVFIGSASVSQFDYDMLNPKEKTIRDTWARLLRGGTSGLRINTPNQFYPVFFDIDTGKYVDIGPVVPFEKDLNTIEIPPNCFALLPIGRDGKERCWGLTPSSFKDKIKHGYIKFGPYKYGSNYRALYHLQSGTIAAIENGSIEVYGKNDDGTLIVGSLEKPKRPVSVWVQKLHDSRVHGAMLLNSYFPDIRFQYPKSLYAVIDTLRFVVHSKPNAVILDFFAGSGTTLHAVNLLNAEDGGKRKCILVTNNEVSEDESKNLTQKGLKPGDVEWEKLGIAKYVTWPRTFCSINGTDINGKPLDGEYITRIIKPIEQKRKIKQLFFEGNILSYEGRKSLLSIMGKDILPQGLLKKDSHYIVSDKHATSIIFDLTYVDEWLSQLEEATHITDIYILTTNKTVFKKLQSEIEELMGPITINENIKIPMSQGFIANVKYFKCTWIPRNPQDYLLSNLLCLHIKEMIELQNAINLDNVKNVLILNKADYKNTLGNPDILHRVENVWVNQNIVWNSDELKVLKSKGFKYIPREFFGQELKEAAE